MLRFLAILAALVLSAASASAQLFPNVAGTNAVGGAVPMCLNAAGQATPCAGTPITGASGNVAAAAATATLAAAAGKTTYICGFTITSTGATAASVVSPTVTGTITGTLTFTYAAVAGATLSNQPLVVSFGTCIPASAVNTAIAVTLPSLGVGNTNATVNAWGFQL